MRIGILFSSGKDSTATLWHAIAQDHEVVCLLSLIPENTDSYMFQAPHKELLLMQAKSLELPIIFQQTKGEKEEELEDLITLLKRAIDEYKIEGIGAGALASEYQYDRIAKIAQDLDIKTFTPLWRKDQEQHMREIICAGFDIRMTRVAADGLDKSWLGHKLTLSDVDKLVEINKKLKINIAGEGGEFETIVLDGPMFKFPIEVSYNIHMENERRGELRITEVK